MVFSCKSRSLLLLKHFWLAVTPSVTWRSIAQRLRAYLWRPSLDFALFFTKMYSWLFSTILVCQRASGGHALITRSLRKTQEINRKRGCYALLTRTKNFWGRVLMSTRDCTETAVTTKCINKCSGSRVSLITEVGYGMEWWSAK